MIDDLEQRVRERAHRLWEREGRPAGRAEAHWDLAQAEETAEAAAAAIVVDAPPRRVAAAAAPKAPKRRSAAVKADAPKT